MQIDFTNAEFTTLVVFLAYALGRLQIADDEEVNDLFASAELLRRRIETLHTAPRFSVASQR